MLSPSGSRNSGARFGETAWSVVLAAGNVSDRTRARHWLSSAKLWPPITLFAPAGFNRHDAQDLTQNFFQRTVQDENRSAVLRQRVDGSAVSC